MSSSRSRNNTNKKLNVEGLNLDLLPDVPINSKGNLVLPNFGANNTSSSKSKSSENLKITNTSSNSNKGPVPSNSSLKNNGRVYTRKNVFQLGVPLLDILSSRSKYLLHKKEKERTKKGRMKPKANAEQRKLLKMYFDLRNYLKTYYDADKIILKSMSFHVLYNGRPGQSKTITYTEAARAIPMYADLNVKTSVNGKNDIDEIKAKFNSGQYISHPHHTLVTLGQNIARMRRLGCVYMGQRTNTEDTRRDCANKDDVYPYNIQQTQKYITVTFNGKTIWRQPYLRYTCMERNACSWGEPLPKGRAVFIAKRVIDRHLRPIGDDLSKKMKKWKNASTITPNEVQEILDTFAPNQGEQQISKEANLSGLPPNFLPNLSTQLQNASEVTINNQPVITLDNNPYTRYVFNLYKQLSQKSNSLGVKKIPFEKKDINSFKNKQSKQAKFQSNAKKQQLENLVTLRKQIRDEASKNTLQTLLRSKGFNTADFSSKKKFMEKVGNRNALPNATVLQQIFTDLQTLNKKKNT